MSKIIFLHLFRYMDESSAVMPSPDAADYGDDSSGISATDFHIPSSPIKARPGKKNDKRLALLMKVKNTKKHHLIWNPS